ncbi:MAG: hypothetical protein AB7V42_03470 [Thermoleophilia bacterium]
MAAETVADRVFTRVSELLDGGGVPTRAEAFRLVSSEVGRSVSAVSSAFYAGARRAEDASVAEPPPAPGRRRGPHSDSPTLYAEMLPLVEAGASIEQAARRFGHDEGVEEIAAGFRRWLAREGGAETVAAADSEVAADAVRALRDAEARITALEAENRALRRDLATATQAIARAGAILDAAT